MSGISENDPWRGYVQHRRRAQHQERSRRSGEPSGRETGEICNQRAGSEGEEERQCSDLRLDPVVTHRVFSILGHFDADISK